MHEQQPDHRAAPMSKQQQQPQPQPQPQPAPSDEMRAALWIGELQHWMDEKYLHQCFAHTREVVSVKIIRNERTGRSEGRGFVGFVTHAAAERVLQACNGRMMPDSEQVFRLNWATSGERCGDDGGDHAIFVRDLASDVTEYLLKETFQSRYPSVKGAKIVRDGLTGRSKGYGSVTFGDWNEQTRAVTEMNGVYCSTKPMLLDPTKQQHSADGYANGDGDGADSSRECSCRQPSVAV